MRGGKEAGKVLQPIESRGVVNIWVPDEEPHVVVGVGRFAFVIRRHSGTQTNRRHVSSVSSATGPGRAHRGVCGWKGSARGQSRLLVSGSFLEHAGVEGKVDAPVLVGIDQPELARVTPGTQSQEKLGRNSGSLPVSAPILPSAALQSFHACNF